MQVKDFLLRENVFVGLNATTKSKALKQAAELASEKTGIPASVISTALAEREELGSTGIGEGVALPHAAIDAMKSPLCLLCKLAKPVDFDAVDEIPVDTMVVLLAPLSGKGETLNLLSCVARGFRDDAFLHAVRHARSADETYAIIAG